MSAKISGAVWDLELSASKRLVLLAMADHADHLGNNVYPSVGLVAWKTGYSESQTRRIIHALVKDRLLVIKKSPRGRVIHYSINLSAGVEKPEYQPDSTPVKMTPLTPSILTPAPVIAMTPEPSISELKDKDSAPPEKTASGAGVPNPWYDSIMSIWHYVGGMNGAMEKMLRGTAKSPSWKAGNVTVPITPDDLMEWAKWYRRTELKNDAHLNMLEDRMKIASSIAYWYEHCRKPAVTPESVQKQAEFEEWLHAQPAHDPKWAAYPGLMVHKQ